ncbi:MAG: glycosyltransferase [Candidatus Daviesbacteria bacterium]|nr:glycosyltransferase [Candidatus Daviesbacteria bacterium]
MKIALVHDDLVQWGGAERMLLGLSSVFPEAPIFTTVFDSNNLFLKKKFEGKKVTTSFLQNIPAWRYLYKALLPLYPIAFEQFDFSGYDLVISQTTRFAKSIITKPETRHICYCHTPPRFLWNFSGSETPRILKPFLSYLRTLDQITAKRVDTWISGSENARERVQKIYHQPSTVIHPFVRPELFYQKSFDGGYLLVLARLNKYKRVDLAIKAAEELNLPLKIVGSGPLKDDLMKMAGKKVEFFEHISDETLGLMLAGCKALLVLAEEDFGLSSLEDQAVGKPVIAYGFGGTLETVIDKQTGFLFYEQTVEAVTGALQKLERFGYNEDMCRSNAQRFGEKEFISKFKNLVTI